MSQIVDVPGMGQVEFPDGMSDAQIVSAIKRNQTTQQPKIPVAALKPEFTAFGNFGGPQVTTAPTEQGFNLPAYVIAAGKTGNDLQQGIRQFNLASQGGIYQALSNLPLVGSYFDKQAGANAQQQASQSADMADQAARYQQLQQVHPGSTLLGSVSPLAPLSPQMMIGAAASSYGSPQERGIRAGAATLGAAAAKVLGNVAARQYQTSADAAKTLAAQNAVRDQTLKAAQDAGFQVPPATVNPSFANRQLESIGGKAATQQSASLNNEAVANQIMRQELGLPESAPLTVGATRAVRTQAYNAGYAPIANAGSFNVSPQYGAALDTITKNATDASRSFPGAATSDVKALVDSYRPPNGTFDAGDALKATQILRDGAREAFRKGDNAVGKAKIAISNALEDEVARQLDASGQAGQQMLQGFQSARQLMAKAHNVEDAIRTGTGFAEASKLGSMAQNGAPLTGGLKTIGDFANAFPKATQKVAQIGSPGVSYLDAVLSGVAGAGGSYLGGPVGGFAAAAALPLARQATRAAILSPVGQGLLARQTYPVSGKMAALLLNNKMTPALAGLLSYEAANR